MPIEVRRIHDYPPILAVRVLSGTTADEFRTWVAENAGEGAQLRVTLHQGELSPKDIHELAGSEVEIREVDAFTDDSA